MKNARTGTHTVGRVSFGTEKSSGTERRPSILPGTELKEARGAALQIRTRKRDATQYKELKLHPMPIGYPFGVAVSA